jgi:hypothetical protein
MEAPHLLESAAGLLGRAFVESGVDSEIQRLLRRLERPLLKLAKNECSIGVFKVARIDGNRQWLLLPIKAKDECSVRGGALPTPRAIAHVCAFAFSSMFPRAAQISESVERMRVDCLPMCLHGLDEFV